LEPAKRDTGTSSKSTTIDSIISSIDIEFNIIDKNGTLEATIGSPVRENRCTVSGTANNHNATQQETERKEKEGKTTPPETTKRKNYRKKQEKVRKDEDTRRDKETTRDKK
jgi:hypothetical protein